MIIGNEFGFNIGMKIYVQFLIQRGKTMPRNLVRESDLNNARDEINK